MLSDRLLIKKAYVECSKYRLNAIKAIGIDDVKTPTTIAKDSGIRVNHISRVLRDLKNVDLVVCLNEDRKKGRLYRLTKDGEKIYNEL